MIAVGGTNFDQLPQRKLSKGKELQLSQKCFLRNRRQHSDDNGRTKKGTQSALLIYSAKHGALLSPCLCHGPHVGLASWCKLDDSRLPQKARPFASESKSIGERPLDRDIKTVAALTGRQSRPISRTYPKNWRDKLSCSFSSPRSSTGHLHATGSWQDYGMRKEQYKNRLLSRSISTGCSTLLVCSHGRESVTNILCP